ncbi:MAG: hypothetical protein IPH23_05710 [Gammaproteobacteria bacterium]|nr:hypothetical protein [Gammaproteobacteria bacterium]MBK8133631.1 hypothetical protein [Gammaproteobacteria bacterium]
MADEAAASRLRIMAALFSPNRLGAARFCPLNFSIRWFVQRQNRDS